MMITKDYAKRRSTRPRNRRYSSAKTYGGSPVLMSAWLWMGAGLVLGLVLASVLYWKHHGAASLHDLSFFSAKEKTSSTPKRKSSNNPAKQTVEADESPQSRFDFYTVLPNMTVDMPEEEKTAATTSASAPQAKTVEKPAPPTESATKVPFIIQVGSFRKIEQADELKAQLALAGFEARIQTVKILGGEDVRYRVYVGPFDSKEKATKRQQELEQTHQFHSLVVKFQV